MKKMRLLSGAVLLWCAAVSGAEPVRPAPVPVTLELEWVEQSESAGYYVAADQKIFREEKLDVTIQQAGTGREALQELLDGKVEFAIGSLGRAFELATKGAPLVNIAQIQRNSGFLLVCKKSSGILKLKDLNGRRIGMWPHSSVCVPARELLRRENIRYQELPLSKGIDIFLYGGVDATAAMRYNEYFQIFAAGLNENELTVFTVSDYVNLPEGGLYTTREFFQKHPDICAKLVRACQRGWHRAFLNPTQALQSVATRCHAAKVPYSHAAQRWMLAEMRKLIEPPQGISGTTDARLPFETFAIAHQLFRKNGIGKELRYEEFAPPLPDTPNHGARH